jgi:hypothetical protein
VLNLVPVLFTIASVHHALERTRRE